MSEGAIPAPTHVVVEADGGSRGNPGPAAYGAVLKDAATGEVLAEDGTTIGRATNNVAEYRGLIAGLRLAVELAPEAQVEVRMDSKLVVEQMAGRWRIKHPDMRPLASEARRLAPSGTTYTWVPRARNGHADRLANEALDGRRSGVTAATVARGDPPPADSLRPPGGPVTTLVLVRHGVTAHTTGKRFSSGLGGADPGLSEEGRDQVRETADWLAPIAPAVGAVVASPARRTVESAAILAARLGRTVDAEPGLAEMEFGDWDGLTVAEVAERHPALLTSWFGSVEAAAPGGETFLAVQVRVLAALDRLLVAHHGTTIVVVTHVTPIKILVARALGAPLEAVFHMQLSPASASVVAFGDGLDGLDGGDGGDGGDDVDDVEDVARRRRGLLRLYNGRPPGIDTFTPPTTTW